jgi:hypothetical protein
MKSIQSSLLKRKWITFVWEITLTVKEIVLVTESLRIFIKLSDDTPSLRINEIIKQYTICP